MHKPADATCLPFPVHLTHWAAASFVATEEELRAAFGEPHFVGDGPETFEANWAWELPDGQRLRVVLELAYDYVVVYCDPPVPDRAITALGLSSSTDRLRVFREPLFVQRD
jgi:hypothetical protein